MACPDCPTQHVDGFRERFLETRQPAVLPELQVGSGQPRADHRAEHARGRAPPRHASGQTGRKGSADRHEEERVGAPAEARVLDQQGHVPELRDP